MDTVFWNKFKFDDNGGTHPQSKTHFTDDLGQTTLCGLTVPDRLHADTDSYGDKDFVECKRCQNKYQSTIRHQEHSDNAPDSPQEAIEDSAKPTEEEITQWLRDNPQVGTLTDGRFYISTPDMNVSPFYEVVEPLQSFKINAYSKVRKTDK